MCVPLYRLCVILMAIITIYINKKSDGIAAFDLENVSGCDQLVVGSTYARIPWKGDNTQCNICSKRI